VSGRQEERRGREPPLLQECRKIPTLAAKRATRVGQPGSF